MAHTLTVRHAIAQHQGAHMATIHNVLNVIEEPESILYTIQQAANGLKPDGTAYFLRLCHR